jgi:hypothetical protein
VGFAHLQGCPLLLSEDFQDGGVFGDVTVRSPFTLAVNEPAITYALTATATREHPRRGRPRRK